MSDDPADILKKARANEAAARSRGRGGKRAPDAFVEKRPVAPEAVVPGVPTARPAVDLWNPEDAAARAALPPGDRDRVLETAAQLFARGGFRKHGLDEVASQADVEKAVLITVFGSKEGLLLAAVTRELEGFLAETKAWVHPRLDATAMTLQLSERAFEYLGRHNLLAQLLVGALAEQSPTQDAELHALRGRYTAVFLEIVQAGVSQRVLRADLDAQLVAGMLMELETASYRLHLQEPPDKAEQAMRRRNVMIELIMEGLRPR